MRGHRWTDVALIALLGIMAALVRGGPASLGMNPTVLAQGRGHEFTAWSPAVNLESIPGSDISLNTAFNDGCPTLAPDGRTLFMASNRAGGFGGQDIWIARREGPDDGWSAPENVGAPINTEFDDFCPSPTRNGHLFFFVSARPGGCGGADIYMTRWQNENHGWEEPVNLGCEVNTAANEASPFLVHGPEGFVLYFSSNVAGGYSDESPSGITGDDDIYLSEWHGGYFQGRRLVEGVNTAANDSRPNLSHDGQEMFFDSNRAGSLGAADIFYTFRDKPQNAWSTPEPLGGDVNSPFTETRPSLAWDGTVLLFGSNRPDGEGMADIYMTTRTRIRPGH
jgi:Tol biopolymer transport system component